MRNQQLLLRSFAILIRFIIFFKPALLNGQPAKGDQGAMSCNTASNRICPKLQNSTLFPFLASEACGSASSFVISGCELSNISDLSRPRWPNFVKAMISATDNPLGPPSVMGFYNPLQIRNPLVPDSVNTSNTSSIIHNVGVINLTWSDAPKLACESRSPLDQISHFLPLSINLTSFAHSVFQLSPSTIILLFNCAGSVSHDLLQKDSPACQSFAKNCNSWKEGSNCYQYTPHSKELNLFQAMKSFDCANATFFVVPDLSLPASQWSPGLIQLNWSTDNPQIASYTKSCVDCLQTNGACGYRDEDNFQCYCTNCTTVENPESPGDCTNCTTVENPESPGDCANCTATVEKLKSPGNLQLMSWRRAFGNWHTHNIHIHISTCS